jgi:hypothetical protein
MSTDATIVIKGRNELGLAVNQAERQLKGLLKTGELVGKLFRGGAIAGAFIAFERLAESAEKAALKLGDQGTAHSLRLLNREIDNLKAKGTNILGQVLGNVYGAFSSSRLLQLREQVDFLRRMQGRSFVAAGYDDIGTGFFTAAEGAKKLLELEEKLALYEKNRPFGQRDRAPGRGGRSVFIPDPVSPTAKSGGSEFTPEFEAYIANLERMGEANRHFEDTLADADKAIREDFAASVEQGEEQLSQLTQTTRLATEEMSVFAEQAGRNIQTAFADFLFDPFKEGLDGMLAGFVTTIQRMVAEIAATELLTAFFTWGSSLGGGIGSFSSKLLSGITGKAVGGPVTGGTPYMVGERGPELFVPNTSGSIVPNHAMGGVAMTYHIDARGADAERIMAVMPGLLKRASDDAVARVRDLVGRGKLT